MLKIDTGFGEYFEKFSHSGEARLSKENFDKYIKEAKLFLENVISADLGEENFEKVKECLFALAEEIFEEQKNGRIRSENIDGYSVSFAERSAIAQRLFKIVGLYLGKSGLVYAGVE